MRSLDTRFWHDGWVREINPLDRYLFIYLLTNDHTTWCGVYELPMDILSFEMGIEKEELKLSMMPRLHPKALYVDGWVYIPNWLKYHISESGNMSPQQKKGYTEAWKLVPERIRLQIKELSGNDIPYTYPMGGVSAFTSTSTITSTAVKTEKIKKNMPIKNYNEDSHFEENSIDLETGLSTSPLKAKKKKGVVTAEMVEVFELFKNPARALWGMRELERTAAKTLFDTYGLEKLTIRLARIEEEKKKKDPYFPEVNTPAQLLDKMSSVERYFGI